MVQLHTNLRERLWKTFTPVFGQIPSFLSDSQELIEWLKSMNFDAFEYKEIRELPSKSKENIILVLMNEKEIPPYREFNAFFKDSRMLIIPLTAFDPSLDAAIYTFDLLADLNLESATQLNEKWLKIFLERKDPLLFKGQNCELTCEISDVVYAMSPKTQVQLFPGDWSPIGSYFEVGMVPQPDDFRPGYTVNGTLTVPGVAVAHHRQMNEALRILPERAWELFQNLRLQNSFPLYIKIEDTRVTRVLAGKKDISSELAEFTNQRIDLMLMEMAVSTNEGVNPENIDWFKNSQLNEGALGIHVGIGDGLTGAHIDFICPGVELAN